jgi:hypothetical protein
MTARDLLKNLSQVLICRARTAGIFVGGAVIGGALLR